MDIIKGKFQVWPKDNGTYSLGMLCDEDHYIHECVFTREEILKIAKELEEAVIYKDTAL